MGKECASCGADIESPRLPEGEDELCDDCEAMENAEGGDDDEKSWDEDEEDDM